MFRFIKTKHTTKYTKEQALEIARKYKLEKEVLAAMKFGFNPDEALQDWDLFPYD